MKFVVANKSLLNSSRKGGISRQGSEPLVVSKKEPGQVDKKEGYDEFLKLVGKPSKEPEHQERSPALIPSEISTEQGTSISDDNIVKDDAVAKCPHASSAYAQKQSSGSCPFLHGSVYADPYPGYVHGNAKRGICPRGCRPELNITSMETPKEMMHQEAMEYLELYYHERSDEIRKTGALSKQERMDMVLKSIEETGTYEHTFDELEHGARVAWRTAPKCSNRKYWEQLKLLDARDVTTNKGMYDACMHHLDKAMASGSAEAYVTVFKPATPGKDGPRIWNDQLLQYAAYRKPLAEGGTVIGDPKNLRFAEMLHERFGWAGPNGGANKGSYDYLPLVMQFDPNESPKLFEVPVSRAPPVSIRHYQHPKLASLGMQWYPIPAVCTLDMSIGGLVYTAAPFNGWYANTKVVRDLTDESRYNLLKPIAKALGFDADTKPGDAPLWIDYVMAIVSMAVYESFKSSKIAIIDHHNLINMFYTWYNDEMKHRKYCPVNWKWVIPPMSSSTSPAYLGLNKAQEYTIKPAYIIGKGFQELETNHFGPRDTTKTMDNIYQSVLRGLVFKKMIARYRSRKQPTLIIYASVTGNASKWASELGLILHSGSNVSFFDACGANATGYSEVLPLIKSTQLVVFVSSTQGNGELPSTSQKFFSYLFGENGHVLAGKSCAVLGFGSTAYPIFCGAAALLSDMLAEQGADEIVSRGECDAVKGEASTFYDWVRALVSKMASMPSATQCMLELAKKINESTASSLVQQTNMANAVVIEVFTADEVKEAAAASFMRRTASSNSLTSFVAMKRAENSLTSLHVAKASTEEVEARRNELIKIIAKLGQHRNPCITDNIYEGTVTSREDLVSTGSGRKTSLLKIGISTAYPPYQPGDHVRIYPRNIICFKDLASFVDNLAGQLSLDDNIHVSHGDDGIPRSEIAVTLPLVNQCLSQIVPLDYLLEKVLAILAPVSVQACNALAELATSCKDKTLLKSLAKDMGEYERMVELSGLKWLDFSRHSLHFQSK